MAQRIVSTFFNRYPDIFIALRDLVAAEKGPGLGGEGLRILSFGCSRGDELQSLRCYFPDATLLGCDVDIGILNEASRFARKQNNTFVFLSNFKNLAAYGPYDAIVNFSVLCRYPLSEKLDNLSSAFAFEEYESLLSMVDENLIDGGLMAIYNSNYRFRDWSGANKYFPVNSPLIPSNGFVDLFDSSGKKVAQSIRKKPAFGHQLVGVARDVSREDLTCAIFRKGSETIHSPLTYPVRGPLTPLPAEPSPRPQLPENVATFWIDRRLYRSDEGKTFVTREWRRRDFDGAKYGLGSWIVEANTDHERLEALSAADGAALKSSKTRRIASSLRRRFDILSDKILK